MADAVDKYYPCLAVASVDLLGMSALLARADKCQAAMRVLSLLVKNALDRDIYTQDGVKVGTVYELGTYFGDSVYLFGDREKEMSKQVGLLSAKCGSLIAAGIKLGFLLRAGIATGDLRIRSIQIADRRPFELRIGTSMAKSHRLQECQQWVGGAVDSESLPMPSDTSSLPYDVPLHLGKVGSRPSGSHLRAVNWVYALRPLGLESKEQVIQRLTDLVEARGNAADAQAELKLRNTLAFVEHVFRRPEYLELPSL